MSDPQFAAGPTEDVDSGSLAAGPGQNGQFQIFPFFTGTDNACTNAIYLLPPSFKYGSGFQPFTVPLLYTGPSGALPAPAGGNADFSMSWSGASKAPYTQANVSVQITITGVNAWSCAAVTRQTLMANFTAFLLAIETLETAGALLPGSARRIGSMIADQMPAPLVESLFWRYSLSPGTYPKTLPYIDIRPGMRLRVDSSVSQFVNPGAQQNSYVAGSRLYYPVGSTGPASGSGARPLSFNGLLATIKSPTVQPGPQAGSGSTAVGAAGAFDLEPSGGARPYWRLIYPASVPSPFSAGDQAITDNVVLLGAASLAALEAATAAYPNLAGNTPPNVSVAFLGRSLVVPEIPVFLTVRNSTSVQWVAVGSTLANLIEQFAQLPLSTSQSVLGLNAFLRPTAFSPTQQPTAPLNITYTDPSGVSLAALSPAMFDLPLIAGDGITLTV
ncbi:MAG TPA: hypothetical protein VFD94_01580 [Jatrophihabitans sp.]|nr:hypothetical protein [Jatrophihabitans sp.]